MSIATNIRWRWLFIGLALSTGLVVSGYFNDTPLSMATKTSSNDGVYHSGRRPHQKSMQAQSQMIALDQLKHPRSPTNADGLFKPRSWYVPPPPPKAPPPPAPVAPALPFSFLGKVQKPGAQMTIVISDKNRVYLVRGGETLDNKYHVDGIEHGKLALTYLPMKKKQYLELSGKR